MGLLFKLFEAVIGTVNDSIDIKVVFDKTIHAGDRQFRHGMSNFIEEEDIVASAQKAIPKIVTALINNTIDVGDAVLVKDKRNNLNIVGTLQPRVKEPQGTTELKLSRPELNFVIITIMVKKEFYAKSGTYTVVV